MSKIILLKQQGEMLQVLFPTNLHNDTSVVVLELERRGEEADKRLAAGVDAEERGGADTGTGRDVDDDTSPPKR